MMTCDVHDYIQALHCAGGKLKLSTRSEDELKNKLACCENVNFMQEAEASFRGGWGGGPSPPPQGKRKKEKKREKKKKRERKEKKREKKERREL